MEKDSIKLILTKSLDLQSFFSLKLLTVSQISYHFKAFKRAFSQNSYEWLYLEPIPN